MEKILVAEEECEDLQGDKEQDNRKGPDTEHRGGFASRPPKRSKFQMRGTSYFPNNSYSSSLSFLSYLSPSHLLPPLLQPGLKYRASRR